jgi:glycosyltransferase involved in cell wall biosynthesis
MIDILMAVYNGEKYLAEQIESVLAQDCEGIVLKIRDDCSTDRSADIIRHYAKRYPQKIRFTQSRKNSGSAAANFFELLRSSTADYVMFCDQDDVWFKDKVSLSLKYMREEEKKQGANTPVLLHTDLTVVNESMEVKAKSMFASQRLDSRRNSVKELAVQNVVTGCTMMLNKALVDKLTYTPSSVPVHDWWIALFTACCGSIVFVDKPTLYYRQHSGNMCGAQNMSDIGYVAKRAAQFKRSTLMIRYGYRQAAEMARVYGSKLGEDNLALLKGYGELEHKPYIERLRFVFKHHIFKDGIVRRIGQLIYL